MNKLADKIIVALDVATPEEALQLATKLRKHIARFKIGLQLYTAAGPDIVHQLVRTGAKVFLDLKLHDIPNTVSGAVASAAALNIEMLTIHLSGGEEMIRAAVDAAGGKLMILGVTVLTSQSTETLGKIGVTGGVSEQVSRLAQLGVGCGVGGLVASPQEAAALRSEIPSTVKIVTPGIRPAGAATGDHKIIATPSAAIAAGADYLVIGRPITADRNPAAAVERILSEFAS
jgi:orotidine-5'-phosphate decarboxylase